MRFVGRGRKEKESSGSKAEVASQTNWRNAEALPLLHVDELSGVSSAPSAQPCPVRTLALLDSRRIASGADDGCIVVWDRGSGARLLTLTGHTLPITTLLVLPPVADPNRVSPALVSAAADRTLRLWDTQTGECRSVLTGHTGSVTDVVALPNGGLVSGANDRKLLVWSADGKVQAEIERQEEENLNALLPIGPAKVVTASNSSLIYVYDIRTTQCIRRLSQFHRESVYSLVSISPLRFASGSLDGVVVLWNSESLSVDVVLEPPIRYQSLDHQYIRAVRCLLPLGEHHCVVGVGRGFRVYEISGRCVVDAPNAHNADILAVASLCNGSWLITAGADGSVRLWTLAGGQPFRAAQMQTSWSASVLRIARGRTAGALKPSLALDLLGHSGAVHAILPIGEHAFATAGSDGMCILWLDADEQSALRTNYATASLIRHHDELARALGDTSALSSLLETSLSMDEAAVLSNPVSTHVPETSAAAAVARSTDKPPSTSSADPPSLPREAPAPHSSEPSSSEPPSRSGDSPLLLDVHVPNYLVARTQRLRTDGYSDGEIEIMLKEEGHTSQVVRRCFQLIE